MQQVMTHSGPLLWAGAVWGFWCRAGFGLFWLVASGVGVGGLLRCRLGLGWGMGGVGDGEEGCAACFG